MLEGCFPPATKLLNLYQLEAVSLASFLLDSMFLKSILNPTIYIEVLGLELLKGDLIYLGLILVGQSANVDIIIFHLIPKGLCIPELPSQRVLGKGISYQCIFHHLH